MDVREGKKRSPSRLRRAQKRLLLLVLGLSVFMLADTFYLLTNRLAEVLDLDYFAISEISLPKFYQGMVLSHTGVGLVLVVLALVFVVWHLPRVWRANRRRAIYTGAITAALGGVLAVTGLFILSEANSRENAWAFWFHVAAAGLLPIFYLAHRRISLWKPSARSYRVVPGVVMGLFVLAVVFHGLTYDRENYTPAAEKAFAAGTYLGPGSKLQKVGLYAEKGFVPANFVPTQSPFFPAATTTTTGNYLPSRIITRGDLSHPEKLNKDIEKYGFVVDEAIGAETCARCHADIVEQWSESAHRFASFNNPFYEATINDLREYSIHGNAEVDAHIAHFADLKGKEGRIKSKWCSGCHDPALMLAGKMTGKIDRTSPQAQAGLTCLACHAIDRIHNQTGNGNYNIADVQEDPYLFASAASGMGRQIHDAALKARPAVHMRQMLKPFFHTSEFCATCHKVSLDSRLNGYRWLRGQDEYDNWHDSGVARNAARTFYLPEKARVCQDCHMPNEKVHLGDLAAKNGYVRSHRFLAVNTALPFLRGDEATIRRIEEFLQDEKLSVDIFTLRRREREVVYSLDSTRPKLLPGESFQLDVVVRNKGVGHTFPGGTNDSNEGWLEVSVLDGDENLLAQSGGVRDDGHVDPAAHFYKALLVDNRGEAIHKRNAQDIVTSVYTRIIGPGTADVAHYSFRVPDDFNGDRLVLKVRLLWRKFDRKYTEFAYFNNPAGFSAFDSVPDLPVSQIAADEVVLFVGHGEERVGSPRAKDWIRFNDYGIGLLLQEDTQGAARAFEKVVKWAPERLDGYRNLARVALRDGNLEGAYNHLQRCEERVEGDPQTAWVWGQVLQEDGRYAAAAAAYRRVLHDFPDDRASWRNLGRVLYLDSRFEEALAALNQTLRIDPEDRIAHYHRMLSLRALGREEEAGIAADAYQYYQIDESAQELTRAYRLNHPHDNRETQKIHVHPLAESKKAGV